MEIAAATRQGWKSGRAKLTRTHTHTKDEADVAAGGEMARPWANFAPLIVYRYTSTPLLHAAW